MYVACKAAILGEIELIGYVSLICNEVTSITLWVEGREIQFLRADRLSADEDNPESLAFMTQYYGIAHFNEIHYETNYSDSYRHLIKGKLQLA
ncbi:hypothetical protein [uncultured Shewanella sp.]|uniref:hypothetical protein n=1 Tax=uncultured Shewanella sp. TaxID=173975 RepID=UPI002602966F|nr:hypothetical protein [uncultured Shewanella sp.]